MKIYSETTNGREYFIIETSSDDRTDSVAIGMISSNNIKGIVPFTINRVDETVFIKYDITGFVSLSAVANQYMRKNKIIKIISSILSVYTEAEEYLINPDSIYLDSDYIFMKDDEANMLVIPLLDKNTGNPPLNVFLKNLICRIKFDSTENCDYIGKMLGYLNGGEFLISDFIYIIDEQKLKNDEFEADITELPENFSEEVPCEDTLPEYTLKKIDNNISEEENDNRYFNSREEREAELGFKLPLDFYTEDTANNRESVKNKKGLFSKLFGDSKSKNKNLNRENIIEEPDLSENDSSTISLTGERKSVRKSFLLRIKNNEKIFIKKGQFRIGTDKKAVDYYIADNNAISRFHAEIINKNGTYYIVDNNSTNHTFIDEKLIKSKSETRLSDKSRIRLANEEFVFYQ